MNNKITRRKFIKLTALVGSIIATPTILGLGEKIALGQEKSAKDLVRNRKKGSNSWFSPREYVIAGALAALIIPSDETGPGALEANVVDSLDRLLAERKNRHTLYKEGLNAFDELARSKYSQEFIKLTQEQQLSLLELVSSTSEELVLTDFSLSNRINRKIKYYYYKYFSHGFGATIDLFPKLVKDVKNAFYTSQVSWDLLGYDGPPQPWGYIGRLSG